MSRPTLYDAPATETIRVRVTPAQKRDLERIAEENAAGVAGVIREAVDEYVADYRDRKCFAVQNDACPLP
jgi:hypothetical protein